MKSQNERTRERLAALSNADPTPSESELEERADSGLPTAAELREQIADEAGECPYCGYEPSSRDVRTVRAEEIDEEYHVLPCKGDGCTNQYEPEFGWRFGQDGGSDPRA